MRTTVGQTLAAVGQTDAGSAAPAVEAVLDVGFRCALFCPVALLDGEVVAGLLGLAVASLATDQRGPVRSACMLLSRLCQDVVRSGSERLPVVAAWFGGSAGASGGGNEAVVAIFKAASSTGAKELVPKMTQVPR